MRRMILNFRRTNWILPFGNANPDIDLGFCLVGGLAAEGLSYYE